MLFSAGQFVQIGSGKPCDVSKVKNSPVKCVCCVTECTVCSSVSVTSAVCMPLPATADSTEAKLTVTDQTQYVLAVDNTSQVYLA
jgi:hypothetical protein